jgi:hypothetical protein
MKRNALLTIASLVTLLLTIFHLTQDVMRQAEGTNLIPIPIVVFALWLCATLMLSDRILGYVIMLFGGLIGAAMIVLHSNAWVISKNGGFFFVWTLFALSTTGWLTAILAARAIWTTLKDRRTSATLGAT